MILQLGVGGILSLLRNVVGRHIGLGMKGIMGECIYDMGGKRYGMNSNRLKMFDVSRVLSQDPRVRWFPKI